MANLKAKLSFLGNWANSTSVVSFYSQIPLGSSKLNGIVLGGWSYSGWDNTTFHTVNIGVLDQNPDGTLQLNTSKYIADPTTNGQGSVITTDLNGDGVPDIFLAAHNESPLVPMASTVYLSQQNGTYKKITLPDLIEAHSAFLGNFNGVPTITSTGYGPTDPFYQFNSSSQTVEVKYWGGTYSGSLYGSSSVLGDFLGDGKSELVIGDFKTGPGYPFDPNGPTKLAIYKLNGVSLSSAPSYIAPLYFDQQSYQNKGFTSLNGGLSHNYRTWTDDFNHDGKLDILVGVGIWSASAGWQKNKLQMLQNLGNLNFSDVADRLGMAYDENTSFVDYSMQILDIDRSGINSYLMAGDPSASGSKQSNYLMLNDGTGRLYSALHKVFDAWAAEAKGANKFIAYQLSSGAINYIAQSPKGALYNLPLEYVVATDFRQDIIVSDRNSSTLIRTWAGNDIFSDINTNTATAHIDGGLGLDTSIYSKPYSNFRVKRNSDGSTSVTGNGVSDTLVNIERLQFSDKTINLTVQAKAASAPPADVTRLVELYTAFFNRIPDADGMSFWIDEMKSGKTINQVAESFYNAGVNYSSLTGFSLTMKNADFINVIYKNVLGRKDGADAGGLSFWETEITSGRATRGTLVTDILDSAHTFKGNATWGWVADLLDNKITVAKKFSIDMGLNYNTPEESITKGMAIASAITATDTSAAVTLIGVTEANLHLG